MLKKLLFKTLILLASIILSDYFIKNITSDEIFYSSTYSRGIYQHDDNFDFSFKPNFSGIMSHTDNAFRVPLSLDEYGFRQVGSNSLNDTHKKVLILGGASIMFSSCLPHEKTIHQKIADHSKFNIEIRNCNQGGARLFRSWQLYLHHLDKNYKPDITVICTYLTSLKHYEKIHSNIYGIQKTVYGPEDIIMHQNCIRTPRGKSEKFFGELLYEHPLLYGILQRRHTLNHFASRFKSKNQKDTEIKSDSETTEYFSKFVTKLNTHFTEKKSKVIFIFLPSGYKEREYYKNQCDSLIPEIEKHDLHNTLFEATRSSDFIADGHYGRKTANMVAQELAKIIDHHLSSAD